MGNIDPIITTSRGMYDYSQVGSLVEKLITEQVVYLHQGTMRIITPYKREDVESAIEAFANGSLPIAGAVIVARNGLLGQPHDEDGGAK